MTRIVRVDDSDYKITVKQSGTITLDTGVNVPTPPANWGGGVIVTGDLLVLGNTTTVQSETMVVKDNIIVINQQDSGNQIALGQAGIEIDRGDPTLAPAAQLFFNESLWWYDNQQGINERGAFVFKKANTLLVGIRTNSITTGNKDMNLNLLGPSPAPGESGTGTATISVSGVENYENRCTDDDDIPNVAWVNNRIQDYFDISPPEFIGRGDSFLRIFDTQLSDPETKLELTLNGFTNAEFRIDRFNVQDVQISDSIIEATVAGNDLTLRSTGTGSVAVEDNLKIILVTEEPSQTAGSVKIYTKEETYGGTGIYFVNNESTRDELISRRKAIAYSMIF